MAKAGARDDPIATPSIWWSMMNSKLNSKEEVAISIIQQRYALENVQEVFRTVEGVTTDFNSLR